MRLLHRLGLGRKKWHFEREVLQEVTESLKNPARGWYQIYTFHVEQEPDFTEVEYCLNHDDTLALVIIDIGAFKDRELSGEILERICGILDFFVSYGYDLIVRAVYDQDGNAIEREPFFFSQVMGHLRQMGEILDQFADSVFIYQGMLVGNWGEMHASRFLAADKLEQMADVLRYNKHGQTYLAVRRPMFWRLLHRNQAGSGLRCPDGMGLFDDGIFGSENHLGTFGTQPRESTGWEMPWVREDELAFEQELGAMAPCGGEVVYGDGYSETLDSKQVLEELQLMQVTYLNKVYDRRVLDIWRERKCPVSGVWERESLYDYIGAHLGYRFVIRKASVFIGEPSECSCRAEIHAENTGFAAFYQEADIWLEYKGADGGYRRAASDNGLKGWRSGEVRHFTFELELCDCEIFLRAARRRDGACIFFANASDEAGRVYLGCLSIEG